MISLQQTSFMSSRLLRAHARSSASLLASGAEPISTLVMQQNQQKPTAPSFSSRSSSTDSRQQLRSFKSASSRRRVRANSIRYPKQRVPTLETALEMPLAPSEMDNAMLVTLGELGNHEARKEILKRHIMCRDRVSYVEASKTFVQIETKNKDYLYLLSLPYHIGIGTALTAGALALPMVFHLPLAKWFNHHYVTTDIPEPADLETMLEVGSWTWNWMEPPLGTISFVLLALQFSRAQIQNLGVKPYTARIKLWRGERLARAFPQYDALILIDYSRSTSFTLEPTEKETEI